jgi:hypothetical protein
MLNDFRKIRETWHIVERQITQTGKGTTEHLGRKDSFPNLLTAAQEQLDLCEKKLKKEEKRMKHEE